MRPAPGGPGMRQSIIQARVHSSNRGSAATHTAAQHAMIKPCRMQNCVSSIIIGSVPLLATVAHAAASSDCSQQIYSGGRHAAVSASLLDSLAGPCNSESLFATQQATSGCHCIDKQGRQGCYLSNNANPVSVGLLLRTQPVQSGAPQSCKHASLSGRQQQAASMRRAHGSGTAAGRLAV